MSDKTEPLRMRAYYYGFDPTGVPEIDRILSAIACAGKAVHHTADWHDECAPYHGHVGGTPVEWIQNAANDAAKALGRAAVAAVACSDCPPVGYPTDKTRCAQCPRRGPRRRRDTMTRLEEMCRGHCEETVHCCGGSDQDCTLRMRKALERLVEIEVNSRMIAEFDPRIRNYLRGILAEHDAGVRT